MNKELKNKLDEMWSEHWKDKTTGDFKNQIELADFERELEYKIWKEAQKERDLIFVSWCDNLSVRELKDKIIKLKEKYKND